MNIGIDVGGTKTAIGLVSVVGGILQEIVFPTRAERPADFVREIHTQTLLLCQKAGIELGQVRFIGAGVPGTVEIATGQVSYCPNIQWHDVPAGRLLSEAFGRAVRVSQDSRNAALAERLFGAGRDFSDFICVSVGTGIGCGIVLGGHVLHGGMNTAGELGHISIVREGIPCTCGNRGCLERYASGSAIFERAFAANPDAFSDRKHRSETVFELAERGDRQMQGVIEQCVDDLAYGLATAVSLLSPQAILISGGLSVHRERFIRPLAEKIYHHGYHSWTSHHRLQVLPAALGKAAPLVGAAFLGEDGIRS